MHAFSVIITSLTQGFTDLDFFAFKTEQNYEKLRKRSRKTQTLAMFPQRDLCYLSSALFAKN